MERQELDVRSLSHALRRSWTTIAVCLLVGLILGLALSAVTPRKYAAASSVILRRAGSSGNTPEGEMATDVAIAHSAPVASRAQNALGIGGPTEDFLKTYAAVARTDDVLVFEATGRTPEQAVGVANTLAEQFLAFRREQDDEQVDVLRRSLSSRITQLQADIDELDSQLADADTATPATPAAGAEDRVTTRLLETRASLVADLGSLQGTISTAELNATVAGEGSKLIESAAPPSAPTQPNTRFNLILGALAGFAVGIGIVVVRELMSTKVRNRQDIAVAAGLPILRSIRLPGGVRPLSPGGFRFKRAWKQPGSSVERALPAVIAELGLGRTLDAVVIVSVGCDGEAGFVTMRLAQDIMAAGRRPLVVDVGEGKSTFQRMLVATGLMDDKREDGDAAVRSFLPTDSDNSKGSWVGVSSTAVKPMGGRSRRWTVSTRSSTNADADVLIVYLSDWLGADELPVLDVAVASQVASVLVVASGRSTSEAIRRHTAALDELGAQPVGVLLVQPDRFDETTGQLDPPPALGATPLRSRAVES